MTKRLVGSRQHNHGPYMPRSKNYHLALAEYLYKLLRQKHPNVHRRQELYVKITASGEGPCLTIDCLDGLIYLEQDGKIKQIGQLRNFSKGTRWSDAYRCAKSSIDTVGKHVTRYLTSTEDIPLMIQDHRDLTAGAVLRRDIRSLNLQPHVILLPVIDRRTIATRDLRRQHPNFVTVIRRLWAKLQHWLLAGGQERE